jgi:hypothetical protein
MHDYFFAVFVFACLHSIFALWLQHAAASHLIADMYVKAAMTS